MLCVLKAAFGEVSIWDIFEDQGIKIFVFRDDRYISKD